MLEIRPRLAIYTTESLEKMRDRIVSSETKAQMSISAKKRLDREVNRTCRPLFFLFFTGALGSALPKGAAKELGGAYPQIKRKGPYMNKSIK